MEEKIPQMYKGRELPLKTMQYFIDFYFVQVYLD